MIHLMNSYSQNLMKGKTILVTGAGKGLGRACVDGLVECGARVIAVARTSADLDRLAKEHGESVETWCDDISSAEFQQRLGNLEHLDGLLNNAGTNRVGLMAEQSAEDLDAVLDLNVRALWLVSQAAIPALKNSGNASVVNMSSQMGHIGSPRRTLYCMSKHAVEGLTKAMAVELAGSGIRVNTVAPTFVLTTMTEPMMADPEFEKFVMGMIPMRKLATPEQVTNACIYLLSDLSGSTTGSCLKVDGGWTAH
jgi:NAD(P)-dependent dehydrogenase (short-subunit alcohol dehydrogenase family)